MEGLSNGNLFLIEVDGFGAASTVSRHVFRDELMIMTCYGRLVVVVVFYSLRRLFLVISGQSVSH